MKKIILGCFVALGIVLTAQSCSEKELVMPESQSEEVLETLKTRPSLRPDSVQVYPAFYNAVEIVYPGEQPDRAVKSNITYTKDDGSEVNIEVTDFDEIVVVEGLSLKEYVFKIVYLTAEGKPSSPVFQYITPYAALTDYPFQTISGYGEFGIAYIHWENVTDREVEITVNYVEGGQSKSVSKLSSKLRDTIAIPNLPNVDHVFTIQVKDLVRNHASGVAQVTINPGFSVENYALSTLQIASGFGRAFLTWENPVGEDLILNLSYVIGGVTQTSQYESSAVNGTYTLVNLPQGAMDVQANFTNLATSGVSSNRTLQVNVDKGVKEVVSDALSVRSYFNNYALIQVQNPSSIPVDLNIKYEKKSGEIYDETVNIASGIPNYYLQLNDVKANATIEVTVTDDIGALATNFNSTVSDGTPTGGEFNRTGWTAAASSARGGEAQIEQLLDGIHGVGTNNGWVNQWGAGVVPIDGLGKSSTVFPHYIQVDMKEIKYTTGFTTVNHSNGTQEGAREFTLQYSLDGITFADAQQYTRGSYLNNGYGTKTTPNTILNYTLDIPILARYVRYFIHNGDSNGNTNQTVRMAEFYVSGVE